MNKRGEFFVETLKRIGYVEADNLEASEYDWMFSEEDLSPFLEVFCTLNENNVLTTEEIKEYSSLTETELNEIQKLGKSGYLEKMHTIEIKGEEICFLQEQLSEIESQNKLLERQVELFKKHGKNLLEDKENKLKLLSEAKRTLQLVEISIVPQAEIEFISSLQSILDQVQNLNSIIAQVDMKESKIPASNSFKDTIESYLNDEEKLLHSVKTFMHNNFQLNESDYSLSFIKWENVKIEELQKEALLLHKMLKQKMMDKIIYETELKKSENIMKYFETYTSDINCHSLHLKDKLNDALKLNQKLKKREEELSLCLLNAISKNVDAQFSKLSLSVISETSKCLQHAIEVMSLPINTLIHQRARSEMLTALLKEHCTEFENLKQLIEKSLHEIKDEHLNFQERKAKIENELSEVINKQSDSLEISLYLPLYKILTTSSKSGMGDENISLENILHQANKYFDAKENISKNNEENFKCIDSMEKTVISLEALLACTNKDYINWYELRQNVTANLNVLDMKLMSLGKVVAECYEEYNQKQKMLEESGNLNLARKLFIYALMNKELFRKYIDDIKKAIEISQGYKDKS